MCKLSKVIHHNMFGPSAECASANRQSDFEIYCHREGEVCIPKKCLDCYYYAGDEDGMGKTCIWEDVPGNLGDDEHVVQHSERYAEQSRVEDQKYYEYCDTFAVEVFLAMSKEQANKQGCPTCLEPQLPNSKKNIF